MCGICGEKLLGKSAYSSNGKRHHYYSHRSTCAKGGLNRINAAVVHDLVLHWLQDIATNGERFRRLQEKGKERNRRRIVDLEAQKEQLGEKRVFVNHSIGELKWMLSNDTDLFTEYSRRIHEVLNQPPDLLKNGLQVLLATLILDGAEIKLALSGVPLKEPVRMMFVPARGSKQQANKRPALIADMIQLPSLVQLRSRSYLERLYLSQHLSIREIARLTDVSHSVVLEAINRFRIPQNGNGHKHPGQIPLGYDYTEYRLVKNKSEQEVIRIIRQFRSSGLSLWKIAGELNKRLVPTKYSWIWQANTVRKILALILQGDMGLKFVTEY